MGDELIDMLAEDLNKQSGKIPVDAKLCETCEQSRRWHTSQGRTSVALDFLLAVSVGISAILTVFAIKALSRWWEAQ